MKMPAANITTDDLVKTIKKRWPLVVSITVLVLFITIVMWSLLFISGTMQRALGVDEQRVQEEIPSIDMDLYRTLKPQWKDFVGGKYIGPTNEPVPTNTNAAETNTSNIDTSNTNISTNANTADANSSGNTNTQ